jgi:hypothetical protein
MDKTLSDWQTEVREVNEANGWHDTERTFGDGTALLHSEVSEMFEAYRDHGLSDFSGLQFTSEPGYGIRSAESARAITRFHAARDGLAFNTADEPFEFTREEKMALAADGVSKPEGVGSEMADVFIRLMDEVERSGIDLEWEVTRKLAYNRTRGHRHGGKRV